MLFIINDISHNNLGNIAEMFPKSDWSRCFAF